jgi:hypothetical protein
MLLKPSGLQTSNDKLEERAQVLWRGRCHVDIGIAQRNGACVRRRCVWVCACVRACVCMCVCVCACVCMCVCFKGVLGAWRVWVGWRGHAKLEPETVPFSDTHTQTQTRTTHLPHTTRTCDGEPQRRRLAAAPAGSERERRAQRLLTRRVQKSDHGARLVQRAALGHLCVCVCVAGAHGGMCSSRRQRQRHHIAAERSTHLRCAHATCALMQACSWHRANHTNSAHQCARRLCVTEAAHELGQLCPAGR